MHELSELAFSEQEYDRRLEAARKAAERRGFDVMLYFDPASICYLSGFSTINLWDSVCLIVTPDGEPVTVFRAFEKERFRVSSRFTAHVSYPHDGNCLDTVTAAVKQVRGRTIGVEASRYIDEALALTLGRLVTGALDDIRLVKSNDEIEVLRRAANVTDRGIEAGYAAAKTGATDYEICADIARTLIAGGSDFMCIQPVVAAGRRTGIAHSSTAGARVDDGDPVFFEVGACVHRYTAPLMRTIVAGKPKRPVLELTRLSSRALEAMIGCMRPGVKACDVAHAGEQVLNPVLSRIAFHYVWGYSVGLGFPPSWLEETGFFLNSGNERELRPGMVFHLPLMLRVPGEYGAGFSETVLVTDDGAETLSGLPRNL